MFRVKLEPSMSPIVSDVPKFVNEHKDRTVYTMFTQIWQANNLEMKEKIACLDMVFDKMPIETREDYRVWRFNVSKANGEYPNFCKEEDEALQRVIKLVYKDSKSIVDFARVVWSLRGAFRDPQCFLDYLHNENLKSYDRYFPTFAMPKSVKLVCNTVAESGGWKETNWNLMIDLVDSELTEDFLLLLMSRREREMITGNPNSPTFLDTTSNYTGTACVSFSILLPVNAAIAKKSKQHEKGRFTRNAEPGDIFLSIFDHSEVQLAFLANGSVIRHDFVRVGQMRAVPEELRATLEHSHKLLAVHINTATINY